MTLPDIAPPLLRWYEQNKRTLPFRTVSTPYRVWVSEIMLQQTRVSAALPYFERFMAELPTVADLAACDPERLHKLWEGLGYYSRVRNLQKAAQIVMEQHGGALPADYDALLKLPRPEYIDLLASLAAENGQGGEALVFSAADRDTVGQAVVDAANGKKPGAGFTLAADTRETGGGVVLQRGRMEINCGFAELLRRARQEDSSAVAAVLFD